MTNSSLVGGLLATSILVSATLAAPAMAEEGWVERSNAIAYELLESGAKFAPEFAGQTGISGYDEEIFDLGDNLYALFLSLAN